MEMYRNPKSAVTSVGNQTHNSNVLLRNRRELEHVAVEIGDYKLASLIDYFCYPTSVIIENGEFIRFALTPSVISFSTWKALRNMEKI
jgi:hypothetical protein